jgi:predicted nucleotidyltransferase
MRRAPPADATGSLDACLERIAYAVALRNELMNESDQPFVPYAQPLLDAVELFERLGIGYALVGGVASMYYGRRRFTEDVDFVAVTGHGDVLQQHADEMSQHHFDPTCTYKLYHESGIEIDIWKDQFADDVVSRAREAQMSGRSVKVAEVHDLIAMKLRAGRLQDDYDISEILRRQMVDDAIIQSRVSKEHYDHFVEIRRRTTP